VAKTTKWQVDRAFKRAARAELQAEIDKLKHALSKTPISDNAKIEKIKAQITQKKYQKGKIRVRRANGNNKPKKGLF